MRSSIWNSGWIGLAMLLFVSCSPKTPQEHVEAEHMNHESMNMNHHEDNLQWSLEDKSQTGSLDFLVEKEGIPWTQFDVQHEKKMHLIVVRSDLTQFQHLHPVMKKDGTWTVPFSAPENGTYWIYADFVATGEGNHVLQFERTYGVPTREAFHPEKLPYHYDLFNTSWRGVSRDVDGIQVGMSTSQITVDSPDGFGLQVNFVLKDKHNHDVQTEPYLGVNGHSVWISQKGEYMHVHPMQGYVGFKKGDWPVFVLEPNPQETYRTFTQFKVNGVVHTAIFDWPFPER